MSKSIPAILGIGVVACVLLSLLMKHLVEVDSERARSPYAPALEAKFKARLSGKVRIQEEPVDDGVRLDLFAVVRDDRRLAETADAMGEQLWFAALRAGARPKALVVRLQEEGDGDTHEFAVAAPVGGR